MQSIKTSVVRAFEFFPLSRWALNFYRRRRIVNSYLVQQRKLARGWLFSRTEDSNFYYKLEGENRFQLLHFVSIALDCELDEVERYFLEIENSVWLRNELLHFFEKNGLRDSLPSVGRRIAWYAIVRILRPKFVVETGVHHGVGGLVLSMALEANSKDGHLGRYVGVDIDPTAGTLIDLKKFPMSQVVIMDSLDFLNGTTEEIDLFIHDSDHSEDYEMKEFEVVQGKMSESAFLLSDNSHASSSLRLFSERNHRAFLYFAEKPSEHWYPGAGIGISRR